MIWNRFKLTPVDDMKNRVKPKNEKPLLKAQSINEELKIKINDLEQTKDVKR